MAAYEPGIVKLAVKVAWIIAAVALICSICVVALWA